MKLYLITHAETQQEYGSSLAVTEGSQGDLLTGTSSAKSPGGELSAEGQRQAKALAEEALWREVHCIILTNEPQTRLTVEPAIEKYNLPTWIEGRLNEIGGHTQGCRGLEYRGPGYRKPGSAGWEESYVAHIDQVFSAPDQSVGGWEPATAALNRFLDGINLLRKRFITENLAIVGHGLVFSLYRAYLLGQRRVAIDAWQQLPSAAIARGKPYQRASYTRFPACR